MITLEKIFINLKTDICYILNLSFRSNSTIFPKNKMEFNLIFFKDQSRLRTDSFRSKGLWIDFLCTARSFKYPEKPDNLIVSVHDSLSVVKTKTSTGRVHTVSQSDQSAIS